MRLVVALGGNAMLKPGQQGTAAEQWTNIRIASRQLAELIRRGHEMIVTHGNGPQIGNIMLQQEAGRSLAPAMPLDICVAQSQGMIGYMLQHSLEMELTRLDLPTSVVTVVTRVEVSSDDPAFAAPSKPIGPFYNAAQAEAMRASGGMVLEEQVPHGWRQVVPSPHPLAICEVAAIRSLLATGVVVIANGGGGIPVQRLPDGTLGGVAAVVDKDLAAGLLAAGTNADLLLILTNVGGVLLDYGTPKARLLSHLRVRDGRKYLAAGHFRPGSMGPKVEAALRFAEGTGRPAVIASFDNAVDAVEGHAGTQVSS
jgi:carbamate kinase